MTSKTPRPTRPERHQPCPPCPQHHPPAAGNAAGDGAGQPVLQIPQDLYIPPDALEVILDAFEGPLDLLLYLIRRQNLDILDIPVAEITRQYVDYIQAMHEMRFELAAEYLVMAAILAEIKSRMLLPRAGRAEEGQEGDPRAELVRRLQEYERFKQAAEDIDALPRQDRDTAPAQRVRPGPRLGQAAAAGGPARDAAGAARRAQARRAVHPARDQARRAQRAPAHGRIADAAGRRRVPPLRVAVRAARKASSAWWSPSSALLELAKEHLLDIVQEGPLAPIYVKSLAVGEGDPTTLELSQRIRRRRADALNANESDD